MTTALAVSSLAVLVGSASLWAVGMQERSAPLKLLSVTPTGEDVPAGRQIVFQFDRPVVPVGRMERKASEVPITIHPVLECEWRWISTSALACQLSGDRRLAGATRYTLTVRPQLYAQDGSRLTTKGIYEFITQRPAVQSASFRAWLSAGTPEIFLNLNQPVEAQSLEEHLYLELSQGDRVELTVSPRHTKAPTKGLYWIAKPVRELPLDERVHLKSEPGLLSKLGPEPSVETKTVIEFFTFPEHRFLGVRCRDNDRKELIVVAEAGAQTHRSCNPLDPVFLLFSSPVIKEVLRDHLTVDPSPEAAKTTTRGTRSILTQGSIAPGARIKNTPRNFPVPSKQKPGTASKQRPTISRTSSAEGFRPTST